MTLQREWRVGNGGVQIGIGIDAVVIAERVLATPGIVQTNLCVDWTQAARKRDIGFEVVSRDVAVLRVIIIEKADIGGEARYDFPLVTYIGVEFSRSEEHTSELQSLMRISYAVFCLKKKKHKS